MKQAGDAVFRILSRTRLDPLGIFLFIPITVNCRKKGGNSSRHGTNILEIYYSYYKRSTYQVFGADEADAKNYRW